MGQKHFFKLAKIRNSMIDDEIREIEEEIKKTPYNKATQKHIGMLKAKLAKLKGESQKKSGGAGLGYGIKKQGDATVLLVGFPSVGKSTLLNKITAAESKVGEYEFTTLTVIPGMLEHKGAKIQVLDVPGLIEGGAKGKGRGKAVLSVIRNADLILILVDANKPKHLDTIKEELFQAGIRLDKPPPDVKVVKKSTGGLSISSTVRQDLDKETIRSVLNELGIYNGDVLFREKMDLDGVVDAVAKNLVYVPSLVVINKIDTVRKSSLKGIGISALKETNLSELKEAIWRKLKLVRIYLKKIGKEPDMKEPLIMKGGVTVGKVCEKIHRELVKDFKHARIWGPSARFPGQRVGLDKVLQDEDIVELHKD